MKIAIRADGGNKIGMGHVMRTLVLAKELAKTNDVFYVCKVDNSFSDRYKQGIDKIRSQGFNVVTIDENNVFNELKNILADCLITDSYDVNEDYFNETKKYFKLTGYIDDMNLYYFNVDFIINQNIGAEDYVYKTNKDTKLFLGTQYVMLRKEFRNISNRVINKKVSNVMITLGGSDTNGITNMILDYVKDSELNFHVVIGPSFEENNIQKLRELEKLKSNIKLYFNANMIEIMNKCDIAISACGSTLYELTVCHVPTLGIIVVDNQQQIARKMDELGMIKNMGWYDKLLKDKFVNSLNILCNDFVMRREIAIKAKKSIDGNGVARIAKELKVQLHIK
ncbi:UDP-2,4-diacetamido-2,4,6-trideoxy-beta-L-altropyranose hydrolase [Clostridium brassicae]|uniref:UDP-2,4-diacetamido-2,4, 6-trideoxy-beta-L-altropyranose hydrolase n=1 Tax=Clostridium brassicae TaxID=2999072 RepID=A0ABT4DEH2_9CLOT|nr:UDP-2,4-diacetamido-2,4,6-trideoxy-beta-L-altropyranose hydrolase [Clostridium brassicae]MCY6959586.1 UDP-2,4-diacetamido-2,4,6-trideoxy-beta-L-altropyranose hydrolase [Clostridium brassicae]